jgi:MarR family transcriptional regulator, transcriptional regulator for hemolysin
MESSNSNSNSAPVKAGQEGVAFLVNQASRAFKVRLTETIEQYGLDTDEYTVLRHVLRKIEVSPDGVSAADLSANLNVPLPIIHDASLRLERDGWLSVSNDAAGMMLTPTRRARSQVSVLADASQWMLEGALNGFSRDEIQTLTQMLQRVVRNLNAPIGQDEGPLVL